jgi:hypothetical protein
MQKDGSRALWSRPFPGICHYVCRGAGSSPCELGSAQRRYPDQTMLPLTGSVLSQSMASIRQMMMNAIALTLIVPFPPLIP